MKSVRPILGRKSMHTPCHTTRQTIEFHYSFKSSDITNCISPPRRAGRCRCWFNWQHSSGQEEPVGPHQLSHLASLSLCGAQREKGWDSGTAHQNSAPAADDEARDEALDARTPSQSRSLIHRLQVSNGRQTEEETKRWTDRWITQYLSWGAAQVSRACRRRLPLERFGLVAATPGRRTPAAGGLALPRTGSLLVSCLELPSYLGSFPGAAGRQFFLIRLRLGSARVTWREGAPSGIGRVTWREDVSLWSIFICFIG